MKKILLDCDEVIVDSGFMSAINDFLGTNYKLEDYKDYYIDKLLVPEDRMDEFRKFIQNRNLYENPIFLPDALEVIERLSKKYDIYLCSSCISPIDIKGSGRKFKDKYDFLLKYLPFLDPNKFIFTASKDIYKVDIQIDDRNVFFENDIKCKILFPSYHNKDISDEELDKYGIIRAGMDENTAWKVIEDMLLK